ncbi:MAG: hypothetical protein C0621_05265 [Desulfuromonas sp.]|nr:MAG: hypothetical protein C0621_05265 [Desulfuromonas sp.]
MIPRSLFSVILLFVILVAVESFANASEKNLSIGILAHRPKAEVLESWTPLVASLSEAVDGYCFTLLPLNHEEMLQALQQHRLDFVFTNPSHYIVLRQLSGFSGVLATVIPTEQEVPLKVFGGVIFTRADATGIATLADIEGKKIACVSTASEVFGGFQMQMYEILQSGYPLPKSEQFVTTGVPQDQVVKAVLAGEADVGFVRTGLLERLAAAGRLDLGAVKVINAQNLPGYPCRLSTHLYPEWPFVALPHVDDDLARRVAAALLGLPHGTDVMSQAQIEGFTIPADYLPVEQLMRLRRIAPYDEIPHFTLNDIWFTYRRALMTFGVALVVISLLIMRLLVVNRRLESAKKETDEVQEELRTIYDMVPDALYVFDFETRRVRECNASACRALHLKRDAVLDMDIDEIIPGVGAIVGSRSEVETDELWTTESFVGMHHSRSASGSFPVEVRLAATHIEQAVNIVATARDIRERQEAEEALRQSEETLKRLIDLAAEAIFVSDERGRIVEVNRQACEMLGYAREELLAMMIGDVDVSHDSATLLRQFQKMILGQATIMTSTHRCKNGDLLPVEVACSPVGTPQGVIYLALSRDMSRHVNYEKALLQARRTAEIANQAKSDFLANMSHEIRTPMNGIVGMVQLLRFTNLTPEQQEYLMIIEQSGETLIELISDILDLSKIEAGKVELNSNPFPLRKILHEILENQKSRIYHRALKLTLDVEPTLPEVLLGDVLRLKQILLNLVGNAVKFTQEGEIALVVTPLKESDETITVEFRVKDTGIGIDESMQQAIFEPFQQEDMSTTRKFGGTGLGLSICRRLVALMGGGELQLESRKGEGSCFFFNVPLVREKSAAALRGEGRQGDTKKRLAAGGRTLNILVAEDHPVNCRTAVMMLEKLGHKVDIARNGREAIALWQKKPAYDVILMDIQMPEMDGYAALRFIRETEMTMQKGASTIVAMTAHAFKEERARGLTAGFDGYLVKPVTLEQLEDELARVIDKGGK